MRINKTKHFKPIEDGFDLNATEIKVLLWFLSFGRACFTMLVVMSCFRVFGDGALVKVLWYIALAFSLLFSLPLIGIILVDSILAIFRKKRWSTVEVLGAAFLGWDRFDAKTGRTPIKINMPRDFFRSDCDLYVNHIRKRLDFFNQEAEPNSRLSFYLCLFDACDRAGIVAPECVNSPSQRSLFLKALGDEYSYSTRSLKKVHNEQMKTKEKDYFYDLFLDVLGKELKDLKSQE